MSIKLGPYLLDWITYGFRDPKTQEDRVTTDLFITHDSGESMGCNHATEARLIKLLDEFWKEEF